MSQTINVQDLDLPQLTDVKRQLDEVGEGVPFQLAFIERRVVVGTRTSDQVFRRSEASAISVQGMCRKCG